MKSLAIKATLTLCALAVLSDGAPATASPRPNIVLILCDDLGYSDVGFNGATDIRTPKLDRLAHAGTIFTSAYVTHPFCGPSRMGLMAGRYPHTFGAPFNLPNSGHDIEEYNKQGISVSETLISTVLQRAGYYTGAIGKWHMGISQPFHPNTRGFDDFYGFLGGGHFYFPEKYGPIYERQHKAGNNKINEYALPLEHNGKEVQETQYMTDALSREAVRFVRDAAARDQPFFLYLAYNAPHTPLEAKEEDLKQYADIEDPKRRTYAAMVHAVDRGVGEVVDALKSTGELGDTLIIFLSDNGGKLSAGATNRPLKEGKGSTFEGGYRVPMFFHWPRHVPASQQFAYPVSALDFYPTLAGLGGASIPEGKQLDGEDIWDDLLAGRSPRQGEMIYALRHRDGYSDVGIRQDQWKAARVAQRPWQLFNIAQDMGELHDLSAEYPERLTEMVSHAEKWSRSHTEPKWFHELKARDIWKQTGMPKYDKTFHLSGGNASVETEPAVTPKTKEDSTKAEFIATQKAKRSSKPNIVLLFADDAGYGDFGFHGSHHFKTPHLDALARSGVRLTNFYVTGATCGPSRAGLLSGRYQQRFGFEENNVPSVMSSSSKLLGDEMGLPVDRGTMGDYLQQLGYRTAVFGKWHLGVADRYHPLKRGFDEFYGMRGGARSFFAYPNPIRTKRENLIERGFEGYQEHEGYLTNALADETCDFIQRSKNKPFFAYVSFNAVHAPMQADPKDKDEFAQLEGTRRIAAQMMLSLDRACGQIIDKLKTLGLDEDTLIVFTNDNGGPMDRNGSSNYPLSGVKATQLEGGIRVPGIVVWPGKLPEGSVYDYPLSTLDLIPTFVKAGGGDPASIEGLDGVDMVPYLRGDNKQRPHQTLYWKMETRGAIRDGDWKMLRYPDRPAELFDLTKDPGEQNDLADAHPEKVRALYQKLFAWELELERPLFQLRREEEGWSARRVDEFRSPPPATF